jgi:hypothetical protein
MELFSVFKATCFVTVVILGTQFQSHQTDIHNLPFGCRIWWWIQHVQFVRWIRQRLLVLRGRLRWWDVWRRGGMGGMGGMGMGPYANQDPNSIGPPLHPRHHTTSGKILFSTHTINRYSELSYLSGAF